MTNDKREDKIKRWFDMWLNKNCSGIEEIFTADAVYIESWGPKYVGLKKIKHWFDEWNSRGSVIIWNIKQHFHDENQTVTEWYFKCQMTDGTVQSFDGVTLTAWSKDEKISFLKEFGCNINNYDPYRNGDKPEFRDENTMWF